jgi:magnesium-transporting ATPase (P-type)
MYIKGADNIIKERLANDQVLNINNELNTFAKVGLRTLIIAMRYISE